MLPGFTVEVLPRIRLTNTELMRRARAGQTEPILLIAEDFKPPAKAARAAPGAMRQAAA